MVSRFEEVEAVTVMSLRSLLTGCPGRASETTSRTSSLVMKSARCRVYRASDASPTTPRARTLCAPGLFQAMVADALGRGATRTPAPPLRSPAARITARLVQRKRHIDDSSPGVA